MMARVGAPMVVLTHLIPAPGRDLVGEVTEQDYVDDLRAGGYGGEVIVASDLTTITIPEEPR